MQITSELLQKAGLDAESANKWAEPLNTACSVYGIDNKQRIAMFLAQCMHESGKFKWLSENLNYSAERLCQVWPSRFNATNSQACGRNPEKIANIVYANRMGNGAPESGEGFKFRGRGIIQLTGKSNYLAFAKAVEQEQAIMNDPDLLLTPALAALSAAWFWSANHLNAFADTNNIKECTRKINGGYLGLEDRTALYNKLLASL